MAKFRVTGKKALGSDAIALYEGDDIMEALTTFRGAAVGANLRLNSLHIEMHIENLGGFKELGIAWNEDPYSELASEWVFITAFPHELLDEVMIPEGMF